MRILTYSPGGIGLSDSTWTIRLHGVRPVLWPRRLAPSIKTSKARPLFVLCEQRIVPSLAVHDFPTTTPASNLSGIVSFGGTAYLAETAGNKIANVAFDGRNVIERSSFAMRTNFSSSVCRAQNSRNTLMSSIRIWR